MALVISSAAMDAFFRRLFGDAKPRAAAAAPLQAEGSVSETMSTAELAVAMRNLEFRIKERRDECRALFGQVKAAGKTKRGMTLFQRYKRKVAELESLEARYFDLIEQNESMSAVDDHKSVHECMTLMSRAHKKTLKNFNETRIEEIQEQFAETADMIQEVKQTLSFRTPAEATFDDDEIEEEFAAFLESGAPQEQEMNSSLAYERDLDTALPDVPRSLEDTREELDADMRRTNKKTFTDELKML